MIRIALGQYDTGWHDPGASLNAAARVIERAARSGADVVMLPEMCTTGFTMDSAGQSEPIEGASVNELKRLAARHRVHVLAGVATRDTTASFHNSALLIDPDGNIAAHYRKQRLFPLGGEPASYSPGDAPVVVRIGAVSVALLICYDLRFADLFTAVAPDVDAVLLIANWPVARRVHWDVLVRARAIECQCYVAAVNRVGTGGGLEYDGGSVICDPWGDVLCASGSDDAAAGGDIATADIDPATVTRVRASYPFMQRTQ